MEPTEIFDWREISVTAVSSKPLATNRVLAVVRICRRVLRLRSWTGAYTQSVSLSQSMAPGVDRGLFAMERVFLVVIAAGGAPPPRGNLGTGRRGRPAVEPEC